jgi:hypothetical protein
MKIYLNTTPCQFTHSKTQNAINYITHLDASRCEPNSENGIHHMTIIVNNNSLIEGRQWNIRLKNDNKTRVVSILSSGKHARFNSADSFIGFCASIEKPDDLIDILVVCNNTKRKFDIEKIIETFNNNRINLEKIGIHKCIFTIMFDEVDKSSNLNNACEFLNNFRESQNIDSIHLITATAYDSFWKRLKQQGIKSLINLRYEISEIPSPKELIENYRKIEDHNVKYVKSTLESNEFIKDIYDKHISNNQDPIRLLAPPSKYTDTHEDIKKFFLDKKFIVVNINSKSKDIFIPGEETISIDTFNKIHFSKKNDIEIYNTLCKLNKLYSNTNIVITGFNCIERGITFQTIGFNFTDMIIPPIKDIATSVQLIGRANGGKKYVKKHNIYIQKDHYNNIENRINYALKLIESNPIEICETDFRSKTDKEKDMIRWEVPISIDLQKKRFDYVVEKKGNRFEKDRAKDLFRENNIDIEGYESAMWNNPIPEAAYSKNIIPLLNAINNNEKICLLHKKDKNKNKKIYSVYFDNKNYNIIIVKYNGNINIERS